MPRLVSYGRKNLDALVGLCRSYAEEVEDYIDSLDVLLNDEAYRNLEVEGLAER